jgi:hypothetical protein
VYRPSALLLVLAITALTACGSSDSGGSDAKDNAAATSSKSAAPAPTSTTSTGNDTTVASRCHQAFDSFLADLKQINSDVAGTPSYKLYVNATRELRPAYHKAAGLPSSPDCQSTVVPSIVKAYFTHLTAVYAWEQCHERQDCADSMAQIKAKWRRADRLTAAANKALDDLTTA